MRIVEGHQKMGKETHGGQKADSIGRLHQTFRRVADASAPVHAAECTGGKGEARREAGIEEMNHTSSPQKGGLQIPISLAPQIDSDVPPYSKSPNGTHFKDPEDAKHSTMLVPCIPPR